MRVRCVSTLVLLGLLGASPALAQSGVTPANVLAGKKAHGFADRTARITSIMGSDPGSAAPLTIPTKPGWKRALRRDADAAAGLR